MAQIAKIEPHRLVDIVDMRRVREQVERLMNPPYIISFNGAEIKDEIYGRSQMLDALKEQHDLIRKIEFVSTEKKMSKKTKKELEKELAQTHSDLGRVVVQRDQLKADYLAEREFRCRVDAENQSFRRTPAGALFIAGTPFIPIEEEHPIFMTVARLRRQHALRNRTWSDEQEESFRACVERWLQREAVLER